MPRAVEIPVNNEVLLWARRAAGLTLNDAAELLGIEEEALASLERGEGFPNRALLRKMSKTYKRPYAVLLMPEPPEQTKIPTDYRTLPGSDERPHSPELALALREAYKYQEALTDIIDDDPDIFPAFRPNISIPERIENTDFEDIGEQIANFLGVNSHTVRQWPTIERAFRYWRTRFQAVGILVLIEDIPREEARGFSLWDPELVPTIVVTKHEHWSAQIFTLFHELAHVLRRSSAICLKEESDTEYGKTEAWCNSVAAATLVPARELRDEAEARGLNGRQRTWQLEELGQLARHFKVSRHVIAIRLQEHGFAPPSFYNEIKAYLSGDDVPQPRQTRETDQFRRNIPQERLSEVGSLAGRAIIDACKKSILTTTEASDLLRMRPRNFQRFEELAIDQIARYG